MARYFCPLTLTVYNNSHQCSWLDNCVITNIEVANIVCDVDNLLISWWLMHRGKLTTSWFWMFRRHDIGFVCTVENLLHRVYRQQTFDSVCCVENLPWKTYCIVCGVENLLHRVNRQQTLCVVWNTYWTVWSVNRHCVWCGKLAELCVVWKAFDSVWFINRHCVWCGKLTEPCESSTDVVCGVENLLNCVWCGKLLTLCDPSTNILCDVENLLTKYVSETWHWHHRLPCKTYSDNTFPQHDLITLFYYFIIFCLQPFTFFFFLYFYS